MTFVNEYRTHMCGELRESDIGTAVRASGWVENIRDHGGILFVDLRDQSGILQVTVYNEDMLKGISKESTITVEGTVVKRDEETYNPKIATGTIEVKAESITLQGKAISNLPFEVANSTETREDVRFLYRFLDLRNPAVHDKIVLRSKLIAFMRSVMTDYGFMEIQTPILSASSPEGARDFLIPSRRHKGKFYALPQAPQIFKQLLMVSGFDKYFQIAPCFRDEDARADRTAGEFYQVDFEMSFATQDDVLSVAEQLIYKTFSEFSDKPVSPAPFRRISYKEAMLKYGTDKPDLRNPLEIVELSDLFVESDFKPFRGQTVRGVNAPCGTQSKGFFEKMLKFAESIGMKGLGYLRLNEDGSFYGPIDKFLDDAQRDELKKRADMKVNDVLFFIADNKKDAPVLAGQIRAELGNRLGLLKDSFEFCHIVDFPMYEEDDETGKYIFTHNPFSMPQGGLKALEEKDPCEVLAYQYDVVCNGIELASGAVRNHDVEIMKKAFAIAGYEEETIKEKFASLYNAFHYGAPPHAGLAYGFDRLLMLITGDENVREVIAFPMNSNAQDVMMGAPNEVSELQLREVHIKLR